MALYDILILSSKELEGLKNDDERSFETEEEAEYKTGQHVLLKNTDKRYVAEIQIEGFDKHNKKGKFKVLRIYKEEDKATLEALERFDTRHYCNWD